jgi:hypothetical protein
MHSKKKKQPRINECVVCVCNALEENIDLLQIAIRKHTIVLQLLQALISQTLVPNT